MRYRIIRETATTDLDMCPYEAGGKQVIVGMLVIIDLISASPLRESNERLMRGYFRRDGLQCGRQFLR